MITIKEETDIHGIVNILFRDCRAITGRHPGETVYRHRPNHLCVSAKWDLRNPVRWCFHSPGQAYNILFKGVPLVVQTTNTVLSAPPPEIRNLVDLVASRFKNGASLSPENEEPPIPITQAPRVSMTHTSRYVFGRSSAGEWTRNCVYDGSLRAFIDTDVEWKQVTWAFTFEIRGGTPRIVVKIGVDKKEKTAHTRDYMKANTEFKQLFMADKEAALQLLKEDHIANHPANIHLKRHHLPTSRTYSSVMVPLRNE